MVDAPNVRTGFADTEDGHALYWRAVGNGPRALVCCNGVGVSTFFFKYVADHFRDTHTVVMWDYRGHGRSTVPEHPEVADLGIERNARDLFLVCDAAGIDRPAVLVGHSMGCQVILEAAHQDQDRVAALVPMLGTFSRPLDTFMDSPYSRPMFNVIKRAADLGGKASTRMLLPLYANRLTYRASGLTGLVDRHYAMKRDIDKYLEHLVHLDPRVFLRMVDLMADHDMEPFLPHVRVPTLVIAAENDVFTPLHRSRRMAALIPGAEILVLAEASHAAIVEHPETINKRLRRFLDERVDPT